MDNLLFKKYIILVSFSLLWIDSQGQKILQLTSLLPLVTTHSVPFSYQIGSNEDILQKRISELKWDFTVNTFEKLFKEGKNQIFDYRYYFLLSRIAQLKASNSKKVEQNFIRYYFKSVFLNLAIQNFKGRELIKDSLKLLYTEDYIHTTLLDSCFPTTAAFTEYAEKCAQFAKFILNVANLNLTPSEKSELYYIIADSQYKTTPEKKCKKY